MLRHSLLLSSLTLLLASPVHTSAQAPSNTATRTYLRLTNRANAVLVQPRNPSPNEHIVAINAHPDNLNTFEYFVGRELAKRGFRTIEINYYGHEKTFEQFLPPIAAAIRYARSLPGVDKVVLVGHSGGGPELTYYQQIAEKGPYACQQADRLYKCSEKGLSNLPKADAMLILEANIGAPHRMMGLDPSILGRGPSAHDPSLDPYASQNGFDAQTGTARYSESFIRRYFSAMHFRSQKIIAEAEARVKAMADGVGQFPDDEPFTVTGTATNSLGPRLNLQDPAILSQTHARHLDLMADGSEKTMIVKSTRLPAAPKASQRDTYSETVLNNSVRHYLSFQAITTLPGFRLTNDNIVGVDWRSSANSAVGSVEDITVPTLVMAGSCTIHMVPLEVVYDHSAASDKQFVVVDGGNHEFEPCRPEFGDAQKHAFDYVETWLEKRFPAPR